MSGAGSYLLSTLDGVREGLGGLAAAGQVVAATTAAVGVLSAARRSLGRPEPGSRVARSLIWQVAALHEHAGPHLDDSSLVTTGLLGLRGWALWCLTELGESEQAIALGGPVVADCERLLGPGHPDTLTAGDNLATCCRAAGRLAEAIPLYEAVRAGRGRVLGRNHPDTLASRSNLAAAYGQAGRPDEAIALLLQVSMDAERVLGTDHRDTWAVRANLATCYGDAGLLDEAIALHRRVLAGRWRILGPAHPDTLASRASLEGACRAAGELP
jgi:hypothetical protein